MAKLVSSQYRRQHKSCNESASDLNSIWKYNIRTEVNEQVRPCINKPFLVGFTESFLLLGSIGQKVRILDLRNMICLVQA